MCGNLLSFFGFYSRLHPVKSGFHQACGF